MVIFDVDLNKWMNILSELVSEYLRGLYPLGIRIDSFFNQEEQLNPLGKINLWIVSNFSYELGEEVFWFSMVWVVVDFDGGD